MGDGGEQKHLTKFQIVQFSSGGFFTVAFYILYFQNLTLAETPSSFSLSFHKVLPPRVAQFLAWGTRGS